MKNLKNNLNSLGLIATILSTCFFKNSFAGTIPPEKIFESFTECLAEKNSTKCDQILSDNITDYSTWQAVIEKVEDICENNKPENLLSCQSIRSKIGAMVSDLYLQKLFQESKDHSSALLEFAHWLIEIQEYKTLSDYKNLFHKNAQSWSPELAVYLFENGIYDKENMLLVLQKTNHEQVLGILATKKEPEALDFIMKNNDVNNQKYLINFTENELVIPYLRQEVFAGKEIHLSLLSFFVKTISNEHLDVLVDLIAEKKIHKKLVPELKSLIFLRTPEYMLQLFFLLSTEEFDQAAISNAAKLEQHVTKILNYYQNDGTNFIPRLNTIFQVNNNFVISYLKNNLVTSKQTVNLLRYIQRNFNNISSADLLVIFDNIQTETAKDSSTLFSTASSKLPSSEIKKYFLNKFFKEKIYLSLEYIFEELNSSEIFEVFKIAEESDKFIWTLFNQTEMKKETFNTFLQNFAKYNKEQGKPALGKFEKQALTNLDNDKLIELLRINDELLSIKIIDVIITEKTKSGLTEPQLNEVKRIIANINLNTREKVKITIILNKLVSKKKVAVEALLNEDMQIDGLGTANQILDQLELILSSSNENGGLTENDLNKVILKIENRFFELKTNEVLKYFNTLKRFTSIIKSGISEGTLKNSTKGLTSLLLNLKNNKVTDSPNIQWSKLQNLNNLDFSDLLHLYFYTKYELANASSFYLNNLSKENIFLILKSLETIQNRMSQQIQDNRHSDSPNVEIPDAYEQNMTEYFITTEDNPIDSQVLCDETLSCLFDFKYKTNLSFYTYFKTIPKMTLQRISYPLPAITETREVYSSDVQVPVSRNISITAPVNDILFIDALSLDYSPGQPLQGMKGRPLKQYPIQYPERYCKKFAKWFGKCIDHGTRTATRIYVEQTNRNGTDGRTGINGHDSSQVTLNLLNKKTSPFSKVIIFSSSGNGGAGANGGDRDGGNVAGNGGAGGNPGLIIPSIISNNKYNIPIVEIQKSGSPGALGRQGY